jgi:hypothetical protein
MEIETSGTGNTRIDREFLAGALAAGELEAIDPDGPDALPFEAMVRYNGDPDVQGSPFFTPPEGQRCKGTAFVRDGTGSYIMATNGKRLRRPCNRWPVRGGTGVCLVHGGGTQKAIAMAKMRLLSAADAVTGSLIKIALDEKMEPKVRVAACNSILDRVGVKAGVDVSVEVKPWQDLLNKLDKDLRTSNGTIIDAEVLELEGDGE